MKGVSRFELTVVKSHWAEAVQATRLQVGKPTPPFRAAPLIAGSQLRLAFLMLALPSPMVPPKVWPAGQGLTFTWQPPVGTAAMVPFLKFWNGDCMNWAGVNIE